MPLLGQRDPRWIVEYPDGKRSERMDKFTAHSYADMFGGKVICVEKRKGLLEKIRDAIRNRKGVK